MVLYPRHVITLQFQLPNERSLLERVLSIASKLLVVCTRKERGSTSIGSVGVTAELRGVKRGLDGAYARALGCQRCRLERIETVLAGHNDATRQIGIRKELEFNWRILPRCDPGPIPKPFLLGQAFWSLTEARQYDTRHAMTELVELAGRLAPRLASEILYPAGVKIMNLDPDVVSWRLAWNLPMSSEKKLEVLSCHSLCRRLNLISQFLKDQDGVLQCLRCSSVISDSDQLLHRTDEGCSGLFVNSHGWIHDMITTSQVKLESVSFSGVPTEEFTWFKGYAWQIFNCRRCGSHLGWRYSTKDVSKVPSHFFGLRRQAIRVGLEQGGVEQEDKEEEEVEEQEESWFSTSSGDEGGGTGGERRGRTEYPDFPYVARFDSR